MASVPLAQLERTAPQPAGRAICVALDGAFLRTRGSHELLLAAIRARPWALFLLPFWLLRGAAYVEQQLASLALPDVRSLPVRPELLAWLLAEQTAGRTLVLVSDGPRRFVEAVAQAFGFDETVEPGAEAAATLASRWGDDGFVWVGRAEAARMSMERVSFGAWLRVLRPHQWVKNLLIFVPLAASHRYLETELVLSSLLAAVAFSLAASSVYVVNDLLDLSADRHHATKRRRPFAAGLVPLGAGLLLAPALAASACALGLLLPGGFLPVLGLYLATTAAYSLGLKQVAVADVVVLAGLYTARIFAGAEATAIEVSPWLLAFSMFLFLSLALVKRYSELRQMPADGAVPGRGYRAGDATVVANLGPAAAYAAVLVLAMFVSSSDVRALYSHPERLWALCPVVLYWVSRVWLLAHRGEMHDDPVVFALRDRNSHVVGVLLLLVMLAAR